MLTFNSLSQQDQELLKSAAKKVGTHATVASMAGLGLGLFAAIRLRRMRVAYFQAFRAMEKPVELRFADGRVGESYRKIVHDRGLTLAQSPFLTSPHSSHPRDGATQQLTSSSRLLASSSVVSLGCSLEPHLLQGQSRATRLRRSALKRPSRTTALTS